MISDVLVIYKCMLFGSGQAASERKTQSVITNMK